ncbi:MAG: beta-ketoacyl synthase N-terminal-like domain-containing protein [Desulfobacteraceae bacterium]
MIFARAGISGTGIACALGRDPGQIMTDLARGRSGIGPLTRFPVSHEPALPVGQWPESADAADPPLTHQLARLAADQAMAGCPYPPDAIVLGVTTGGMAATEELLKCDCARREAYRYHGIGTVADDLARRFRCKGPVLTVSTACSSGGGAIALALAMVRSGRFRRVLTGGVDSLCRLTYYGFRSLQLIDPQGCRPLDKDRRGMSVAEGAGILLLEARSDPWDGIEILGAGLSCDAHHPAQPHPQGLGALAAMRRAVQDAGLEPQQIDYINLHGTGTPDNDRSEALAVKALFGKSPPPLSSIKGALGHSLAASGAIEAVVATHCIEHGWIPVNTGCRLPDPSLELMPVDQPVDRPVESVLSNSFGFGGNNAAIVIGRGRLARSTRPDLADGASMIPLTIMGWSAVTGAGFTDQTLENLFAGVHCRGCLDAASLCRGLPPAAIRRLKRLSQMALALWVQARDRIAGIGPKSVFFGTAWGSLSETNDFMQGLFASDEKFASPTDFIGSVHNAAGGQIALMAEATGANLTLSGGDTSFEQALFSAQLLATGDDPIVVAGAEETHARLSPLFDPSVAGTAEYADGGGMLILRRAPDSAGPTVALKYFAAADLDSPLDRDLVTSLGGAGAVPARYGLILVGMPAAHRPHCQNQLDAFLEVTGYSGAVIDYRRLTGEFAASAAVAAVFAAAWVQARRIPFAAPEQSSRPCQNGNVLILGLGPVLSAIEVGLP